MFFLFAFPVFFFFHGRNYTILVFSGATRLFTRLRRRKRRACPWMVAGQGIPQLPH